MTSMNINKPRKRGRPVTVWTDEKLRLLKKLYPKNKNRLIATQLRVSSSAVRQRAFTLGLKKQDYNWSDADKAWLVQNYLTTPLTELMETLARTEWAIINQYRELTGLRPQK